MDIANLMCELDVCLTGKTIADARQMRDNQIGKADGDIEYFLAMGEIYYLSDGGYSRIRVDLETRQLFLTSESRDEVKKKWESVIHIRSDIEEQLKIYYKSYDL